MIIEEQRSLHEDIERLEQAISERLTEEPRNIRERLARDHQIANFLQRIQDQSKHLLDVYDGSDAREAEIQKISTGEPFDEFYRQLGDIKSFHRKYPNAPVENLERAYKRRPPAEGESATAETDRLFTGEEAWGRYLDLTLLHEEYLNLAGVKRLTYLQYLDIFDVFAPPQCPIKNETKRTDQYFGYVGRLADYLQSFLRRTRPLEDLDKLFSEIDRDFEKAWDEGNISGWEIKQAGAERPGGDPEAIWCEDCQKEFKNENVYKSHLTGKKHIKAAAARKQGNGEPTNGTAGAGAAASLARLKDRAIAEREYRVARSAAALSSIRSDTRVNVERKQGMTERERQQELEALFAEGADGGAAASAFDADGAGGGGGSGDEDDDDDARIYNPLKLPLAWDGKPIPFWLYKLHGLGVEFPCEICGNFVYMGRRAFEKHFTEARHLYGLRCLGVTNTSLFREITGIQEAVALWEKIQRDKKDDDQKTRDIVQMEDAEGNVMPEKVYYDLQKQGLL